jgi:hypothetical protein
MTHNATTQTEPPIHPHGRHESQAHVRAAKLPAFRACLERSGMSEEGFIGAMLQTSLSRLDAWTLPDLERLLTASLKYELSPVGREIFLCPDPAGRAPLLVVGVDGWSRLLNDHDQFAGMRFKESDELVDGIPAWVECTIHRRDRRVPTAVREYLCEVRGTSSAWITHPRRMLRHKAMVQCARVAFGLGEIVDPDEADQIARARRAGPVYEPQTTSTHKGAHCRTPVSVAGLKEVLAAKDAARKTD